MMRCWIGKIAAILGASLAPAVASAQTVDTVFMTGVDLIQTASRVLVYVASALGIGLVAWSMFQLVSEPDDQDRWKHVAAAVVGSLFTIFGVIVGFFSGLFA